MYEICTYLICFIGYVIYTHDFMQSAVIFLNGITFFSFVFLSPINESSPSINIDMIIYAIFTAILTFVLVFIFKYFTGAIVAVLISSIIYRIYDIIRQKRFL